MHRLNGCWSLRCVNGMDSPGKGASSPDPAWRSLAALLVYIRSLALLSLLFCAQSAGAAVDRSILKSQEGSSALLRGRYDLAIAAFDDALKDQGLSPARQASLLTDRGVAKWRLKQPEAALADFMKAISLNADYAPAYNNRGTVLMEMNRVEEAYKDFDRAVALSPGFGAAYTNRANANYRLKKLEAAESDFRKAIELMPASSVPLNGRGKLATMLGRHYTGLRYLNRALTLNAQYGPAYQNRAAVYTLLKRGEDAIQDLDKVIALAPDNASLYVARGQIAARDKHGPQAFRDFSKALELAPDNVPALIGRAGQNFDRRRPDLALEDVNRALIGDPMAAEAYYWRAQIKEASNDAEGAESDLSKAIELDPSFADAYRIRARIRDRAAKHDDAVADYRRALELDPFSKEVRDAYKAVTGETPDSVVRPLAPAVDGWEVFNTGPGQFTALNDRFPKMPIPLEVQGAGPAEIAEWTPLKDTLTGIGLLRYRCPNNKGGFFEYVAIVDLSRAAVISIEPYITAGGKSKWAWTQTSVTVTDADGLTSYYELRKPRPENIARRDSRGGLFGWLFR